MRTKDRIGCYVVACVFLVTGTLTAESLEDKTLSPYFAIEGGDPSVDKLPLKKTCVDVSVSGVLAYVTVTQTYVNNGERPISARYIFPASTRAAVHGMKMTIGEHVIAARIKERQKAQKEFQEAKEAGKSASLLEQQRPNVFSMDIANIMPKDVINIELRYSELLVPTNGTYEFVYPTVVGPRYSEFTGKTATDHDKWVKSPYLREGEDSSSEFDIAVRISTGIPLEELTCSTHETDVEWDGKDTAAVSLAQSDGGNRDFILKYRLMGRQIQSGVMLYEGKEENFFLLMTQPPEKVRVEDIPGREYIFVVDVSGSMNGFPISISKELLRSLIGSLRPTDTFNVILFAASSSAMSESSIPASGKNIDKAIVLIDRQTGGGGTRLRSAMERALAMPSDENVSRSIVVVTDGYISAEKEVFVLTRQNLNKANVFAFGIGSSVNRYLIEGLAKAGKGEPFIVTDKNKASAEAARLREYIESPLLTGVSVEYDGFEAYAVEPVSIPDLMAKRPLQVFGKWRGKATGRITVSGMSGGGKYEQVFDVSTTPARTEHEPLRYLWARTRVAELTDYNFRGDDAETTREVTSLGLTYDLLTEYTSFVAVHKAIRNTEGNSVHVAQPNPLPEGVSALAVGGGPQVSTSSGSHSHTKAPEPEMLILLVIVALGIAWTRVRRRLAVERPE